MTYTPQTLLGLISYFENAVTNASLFYYETSTNTINFGYGVNLTSAEQLALSGNSTIKNDITLWLSQNGITLTETQWQSFATTNLNSTNGPGIALAISNSYSSLNAPNVALNVLNSFVNNLTVPGVTVNVPNLLSLPLTTQWALESMYYNSPATLGANAYGDANSNPPNLAGIAEQIAFDASAAQPGSSGAEERYLGAAMLALGVVPTFDATNSNQITNVNPNGAAFSNQPQSVAQFLYDVLNPSNLLGHTTSAGATQSAQSYVSSWGSSNVSASYNTIVSQLEAYLIPNGYYVVQSGDTASTIISTLANGGMTMTGLTTATLLRLNSFFGVTGINTGALLHVPVSKATLGASPPAQGYTSIFDATTSAVYTVGASLPGLGGNTSGELVIDQMGGAGRFLTFAPGTYSGVSISGGNPTITLTGTDGVNLGTLALNVSAGTGVWTSSDGLTVNLSAIPANAVVSNAAITPEQTVLGYLSQLGDPMTSAQLDQADINFYNPTGTQVTASATVGPLNGSKVDVNFDFFTFSSSPNEIVAGPTTATYNHIQYSAYNILSPYTQTSILNYTISNIQELYVSAGVTLSGTQFNYFSSIVGNANYDFDTLTFTTPGTYSLRDTRLSNINDLTAESWLGTTLIGSDGAYQTLDASLYGNDTLTAGNGNGDVLFAGFGVDSLSSGTGNDLFSTNAGVAVGSIFRGGGGQDTLYAAASDISGAAISGIQTLEVFSSSLELTGSQFNAFTSLVNHEIYGGTVTLYVAGTGTYSLSGKTVTGAFNVVTVAPINDILDVNGTATTLSQSQFDAYNAFINTSTTTAATIKASGAGTYDLATVIATGNFNLDASAISANVTLVGSNQNGQTLNGSTGTDTITTGTGTGDVVNSNGTGDTVNANGTNDWINANGSGTVVNANGASDTVVGNGANEWINANGNGDTVTVTGTNDTVVANGTNIWVNGNGTSDVVTTSNTGDSINVNGANIWVNANGNNDSVTLSSTNDSINVNGANTWVNLNGTGDNVTLSSTGDSINANSNNDWLNINGTNDSVTLSGTNDSVNVNGANVWSNINGTGDSITTSSTSDTINLNGTGCWINVNGASDAVVGTGTGNTINVNSTSDTVSASGDTINIASGVSTTLNGGGKDVYEFAASFGQDTINNLANGSATTANGQVGFGSGVTDEKLWFQKSGNNLLVDLLGTTDQITIDNWYGTNAGAQVQTFTAGSLKLDTQVAQLVQAMASYGTAHPSFNPTTATAMPTDTTLQSVIAASWHS